MSSDINNTKEVIKNRMLKHALTYWDLKNTDDLDPAVKLILEALSLELYNLGNEIKDTQVRILEKLADLLSPDFLTAPHPAHALLHATPVEPAEVLSETTSFITQTKISSKQNEELDTQIDIYFTSVDAIQLFDAQINYMAAGGSLYAYDSSFNKHLLVRSKERFTENNTLWLGLKINPLIEDIQNLTFCFDWKNQEEKMVAQVYQLLPLTKWFIEDKEIENKSGIQYVAHDHSIDEYQNIFFSYDLISIMEEDIKSYYNHKFISISATGFVLNNLKQNYPPSFTSMFLENDLKKLNEKLLWLKVVFPDAKKQHFLEEVHVYPNTFPVMNRQVNDLKYRLKGGSNIIPLKTGTLDHFLSVKSLSDDQQQYKSVPYRKTDEEERGTFTLRNGGVERFDNRNARELISYLLELLRSESAAFAAFGYDFIAGTLKEMNQRISLMEQKTKGHAGASVEIPNYIIVRPLEGHDIMYAEYWTTLAEVANNLRSGTKVQQLKGVIIKQESLVIMTTTTGGKNRLRPEERLNAFRYGIMTRNRIITKDDIRNFCFYDLGDRINKVEIERGFEMIQQKNKAFRRTIDIKLTPSNRERPDAETWKLLCDQLKSKLQTRSGVSNYYRVMVVNS